MSVANAEDLRFPVSSVARTRISLPSRHRALGTRARDRASSFAAEHAGAVSMFAAGGAFACAASVAALKDEVVGELARSVPLAVPLLDDFDHSSQQYDELAAGAISAF